MLTQSSSFCCCQKWQGVLVVVGGVLIHLSLGTLYTFGNLSPYLTSYMRVQGSSPNLTYTECAWIFALALMGQGASMFLGGLIERKIGPKLTALLGGWCMSLGVMLTFFSIKQSFALAIVTYGLIFGFGVGIAYAIPLSCAMKWFPERKGLVNGLVVAGFGGGAFIFNQVQTAFINPDNLKPDKEIEGDIYFGQASVLDRVPYIFLLLGGCYSGMQLIGSLLLCNPPSPESENGATTMEEEQERAVILTDESQRLTQPDSTKHPVNVGTTDSDLDSEDNLQPLETLKTLDFYYIWFLFVLNGQGSTFIPTLYKAYGQTFISDDTFMAVVGSFAALFNAGGRILWGSLADRFSFRVSAMTMCACFTSFMLTFEAARFGGKAVFFIYVCLLFGSFSGSFALFPTVTAKRFGHKYLALNYGLVFTSQIITAPLGVFLSQKLKASIGWNGLFFLIAGFYFVSFILTIFFKRKDKQGKEL